MEDTNLTNACVGLVTNEFDVIKNESVHVILVGDNTNKGESGELAALLLRRNYLMRILFLFVSMNTSHL